ncbi:hypothetical protein CERZMDRAFT_45775 [Cercospora zeae-maydis SCOH1-5]|uniref:ferric-chelate reductase (NADPH) n=1 Tax=Cercospora zeae-maydis SCOH1-5 TaxID=717836 RepID=A0A6A6FA72_9PEZI|nr:hypothetical protein CERZMDRAFT_45775 [Cercospora zeae-maydis SCOH1-5]
MVFADVSFHPWIARDHGHGPRDHSRSDCTARTHDLRQRQDSGHHRESIAHRKPRFRSRTQCFVAVVLLAVLPVMRRFAYEWFLYSHLALSVILAVCLWEHVRLKKYFNRPLMLGATGAFLLTSGVRYAHHAYQNIAWNRSGPQMIHVVRMERLGSSLVLELKLSRAWTIVPGQHVYLTILTWREFSVLQRHPFMITWWQSIPGGSAACSISVVIRQNRGWTRRIQNYDGALPGRRAWLRGPYGAPVRLEEFGTVIMFASGDGIFAQLPFIRFLTDRSKLAAIKTRRIKLVWQTNEYHDRLQQWMQSIMDDEDVEFDVGFSQSRLASS